MTKLRIHYFKNEEWGRYHLPWIQHFASYLEKYFKVELLDYYRGDGKFNGSVELQSEILYNSTLTKFPAIGDTDFVIENLDTKDIVLITFVKSINHRLVHWVKNKNVKTILTAHYSDRHFTELYSSNNCFEFAHKIKPWIFGFFKEFDVDKYRKLRGETKTLNSNLFFKGGGTNSPDSYRGVVFYLNKKGFLDTTTVPHTSYLEQLAKQEIGFSHYLDLDYFKSAIDHLGELCYRDIEMMSIGVPYIRVEYKSQLHNAFIPNHHYICIPREDAFLAYNKGGDEAVAELVIEKYKEVKNNKELLKFISNNQKDWYDTYMRFPKSAELAIQLSDIKNWI